MCGFGFGVARCTGFINISGLFMSIINYLTADQIMVVLLSAVKSN
jgi:hypothetical protein